MKWCVLLALATVAEAQDPVRVVSCLRDQVYATVQQHLRTTLPDVEFAFERLDEAELVHRVSGGMDVDVVCGVDAQLCAIAADEGLLLPQASDSKTFCDDPRDRYRAPWAAGWVFVSVPGRVMPPDSLEELTDPAFTDLVAMTGPRGAPSLWAGFLRHLASLGRGEKDAVSWLALVDARVVEYPPTIGAASAEFELGRCAMTALPTDRALLLLRKNGAERVSVNTTREGLLLQPLAVATPVRSRTHPDAARVYGELFSPALFAALRKDGLFTSDGEPPASELVPLWQKIAPYAPLETSFALRLLSRWTEEVRGRGREFEDIGLVLDVVFTVLFFGAGWLIFRNMQNESAQEEGAHEGSVR